MPLNRIGRFILRYSTEASKVSTPEGASTLNKKGFETTHLVFPFVLNQKTMKKVNGSFSAA